MADEAKIVEIAVPKDAPLEMTFVLHYKDGSYDHTRSGRVLEGVELPDGSSRRSYELEDAGIPGFSCRSESERGRTYEEKTVRIAIEPSAPLPLELVVREVDEYHPDYWNQLGLSWEEREPRIANRTMRFRVVSAPRV